MRSTNAWRPTLDELRGFLELRSTDAARRLGVSINLLKRAARALGIPRWPARRIAMLRRLRLKLSRSKGGTGGMGREEAVQAVDRELHRVLEGSSPIPEGGPDERVVQRLAAAFRSPLAPGVRRVRRVRRVQRVQRA